MLTSELISGFDQAPSVSPDILLQDHISHKVLLNIVKNICDIPRYVALAGISIFQLLIEYLIEGCLSHHLVRYDNCPFYLFQ